MTKKYQCLAFCWGAELGSESLGVRFRAKVDDSFHEWVDETTRAGWLRNFSRSRFKVDGKYDTRAIAKALLVTAIWGYGVDGWPLGPAGVDGLEAASRVVDDGLAHAAMCNLEGVRNPNPNRSYMWDAQMLEAGLGHVPCAFADLDRWLERLWADL